MRAWVGGGEVLLWRVVNGHDEVFDGRFGVVEEGGSYLYYR